MTAPDFIIGGAPRSGTTGLAATLDRHPRIALNRPLVPEPKVFLLPGTAEERLARYAACFAHAPDGAVLGEKTTNYLESPAACEAIRATLPEVRMVFVLREPAARAHSNWLWSRRNGFDDLPFAEALAAEGERPDPLGETAPHARPFAYAERSRYATLARPWLEALGPERVHFVLHETLLGPGRGAALAALQEFLGVEPEDLGPPPTGLGNEAADSGPPLDAETAGRLRAELAPEVHAFAHMTGLDVASAWGYA